MKGEKYLNKTFINRQGCKFRVIEYINTSNIRIIFDDYNITKNTSSSVIKNGGPINPMYPNVYGVGYLGIGKYVAIDNGIRMRSYDTWHDMLRRCYDKKISQKHSTYSSCVVCEEWHNYQIFAKWYDENYYEIDNHRMNLDKDILVKGNKVYSPDTCVFVDDRINKLFTKSDKIRGDLPIGVRRISPYSFYACSGIKEHGWISKPYYSAEEAFVAYKESKEQVIRQVAEEYKDKIPEKLYFALLNYKVEITD